MKRREFIILSGIGATSASLLSACGHPEEKLIPAFIPDDEYVPGIDYWKASTCGMCPAGCGIIVRTREHKANKIEGNPLHPVNRGALCARGQAGLEVLYNPDRIKGPLKRAGERGEGKWEEISWDEGIKTLADKLRALVAQGKASSIACATSHTHRVNGLAFMLFAQTLETTYVISAPAYNEVDTVGGYSESYHRTGIPTFDLANSTYLISFGARFLETWFSPVMYSLAYGEFRRSAGRARGKFVHVEPRMSLTAANADEWLPAAPGSDDLVALGMAQVILREGLAKQPVARGIVNALEDFAPEKTAELTDLGPDKVVRIAREFISSERPLAIGAQGGDIGSTGISAVNLLNALAGNWNKPGGMFLPKSVNFNPLQPLYPDATPVSLWHLLDNAMRDGKIDALLVHDYNAAYFHPNVGSKLRAIPFVASFSSFMDESTMLADLILPDCTYLESWNVASAQAIEAGNIATLTVPVLEAQLNTRQTADVLIDLSRELGKPLPVSSAEDIVRRAANEMARSEDSSAREPFDEFWKKFVERGVWIETKHQEADNIEASIADFWSRISEELGSLPGEQGERRNVNPEYPLTLMLYDNTALGRGEYASLPSLQELPDAMTSVLWGSWIEINPRTAESLGIADGDLLEVRTADGSITGPAVLYRAIRPDTIAMPYGQGHAAYGRYGSDCGANAFTLLPPVFDPNHGPVALPAKLTKIGAKAKLIRFGTELQERMEKRR